MNRPAMTKLPMTKRLALIAALFLPLAMPFTLAACNNTAPAERPPLEGAAIGVAFTLMDEDGKERQWSDFDGSFRRLSLGHDIEPLLRVEYGRHPLEQHGMVIDECYSDCVPHLYT